MQYLIIAALCAAAIFSQATVISQYIWIQYGQVPTQDYDEKYVRARLPCQTRIGKCTYKYDQIPRGWFSLDNGDLLVPKSDLGSVKIESIIVTMSEPTGQDLSANLIVDIEVGQISVYQRNQFLNNLNYRQSSSSLNQKKPKLIPQMLSAPQTANNNGDNTNNGVNQQDNTNLLTESATKETDNNQATQKVQLRSLRQIRQILQSGSIINISTVLSSSLSIDTDCETKLRYLEQLNNEISLQLSKNEGYFQIFNNEFKQLRDEIQSLKTKKSEIGVQLGKYSEPEIQARIKQLEKEKQIARAKEKRNANFADLYFLSLQRSIQSGQQPDPLEQAENNQTNTLMTEEAEAEELLSINEALFNLIQRKNQLEQLIALKNINITIDEIQIQDETTDIEILEGWYREYSERAVKAKIEAQDADYELRNYQLKLNQEKDSMNQFDKAIQRIKTQINSKKQLEDGRDMQDVLKSNQALRNAQISLNINLEELGRCWL